MKKLYALCYGVILLCIVGTAILLIFTPDTIPVHYNFAGYAFIGWDKDFSNVTEDMTVTAQYSANSYSITYTINGEEYAVRNYEYGAAVGEVSTSVSG